MSAGSRLQYFWRLTDWLSGGALPSLLEPVLGSLNFASSSNPTKRSQASAEDKHEEQEKHDASYKPEGGSP